MLSDVRSYYGFAKDFGQAGYFETSQSQQIVKELSHEIRAGKLVTLSGIVGCGKTTMLRRIQDTQPRTGRSWCPSRFRWRRANSVCPS